MFGSISSLVKGQGLNILLNLFFNPSVNAARGIAFQIKNDLGGLEEDIKNGVKTAPIIYYKELTQNPLSVEAIQNSAAIEKTKNLIGLYAGRAIENIAYIEDNQYKKAICDLCRIINQ